MSWINAFEIICYALTASLIADILKKKNYDELGLFFSAAIAGFILELLAVYLTDVYHYSDKYYITIGMAPYQFPFFGGLMWGSLAVCALRMAQKLKLSKSMTALFVGWIIVSMDLLLDVAAIRLNGGFWTWEGRELNLTINHHAFMSVVWVNFLGYLFETPTVVYLWLAQQEKGEKNLLRALGNAIWIGLAGDGVVGLASAVSLWLDQWSDEWFSFLAFAIIWIAVFIRIILYLVRHRKNIAWETKKDKALLFTWGTLYSYCLAALIELQILQEIPLYALFAISMLGLTLLLSMIRFEQTQEAL